MIFGRQNNGLLVESWKCDVCGVDCNLCQSNNSLDGVGWRCPSRKHEYRIRTFSFFEKSHFSFQDILQFIKCFLDNNTLFTLSKFSGLDYKKTSVVWANFIRDLYKQWVSDHYDNVQLSCVTKLMNPFSADNVNTIVETHTWVWKYAILVWLNGKQTDFCYFWWTKGTRRRWSPL